MNRILLVVLFVAFAYCFCNVGIAGVGPSQTKALAPTDTIAPGETKSWGPVAEGNLLRVFCQPKEAMRLRATSSVKFLETADLKNFKSGAKWEGSALSAGDGNTVALNIYAAKDLNGPWQWLQCTVNGYDKFFIADSSEIGYTPQYYMFEFRVYGAKFGTSCHNSGMRPIVTLSLDKIPASTGQAAIQKDPANSAISRLLATISTMRNHNPVAVKAFVDSGKILATAVRSKPEAKQNAETALKGLSLIERQVAPFYQRYSSMNQAAQEKFLSDFQQKLVQAVELLKTEETAEKKEPAGKEEPAGTIVTSAK